MSNKPTVISSRGLQFADVNELYRFAQQAAQTALVPKDFQGNPAAVLCAMQYGMEIGLTPMTALQTICVIHGRPAVWGDGLKGLVMGSGLVAEYKEEILGSDDGTYKPDFGYRVTAKRKDSGIEVSQTFTVGDAGRAGLWGKGGPWTQYPKRMLLNRARSFTFRDLFPDVTRGLTTAEEAIDHPESADAGCRKVVSGGETIEDFEGSLEMTSTEGPEPIAQEPEIEIVDTPETEPAAPEPMPAESIADFESSIKAGDVGGDSDWPPPDQYDEPSDPEPTGADLAASHIDKHGDKGKSLLLAVMSVYNLDKDEAKVLCGSITQRHNPGARFDEIHPDERRTLIERVFTIPADKILEK